MRIGIFHFRVGGTDGVSLEIEKWEQVLGRLGHSTYLCAGDLGTAQGTLIRDMYHHLPEVERFYQNTFYDLADFDPGSYHDELQRMTGVLVSQLREFIKEKELDFLLAENIWSVAVNPAVAIALERVREELDLPAVAHNHDFYWEHREGFALTCSAAAELADKYLPPRSPRIQHTVINSLAQKELQARKGISSIVIPNVFDFNGPAWEKDDYNSGLRKELGLSEDDIVLLQATRIVPRKGIELAIDFAAALQSKQRRSILSSRGLFDGRGFHEQSRFVLVLAGYVRDERAAAYKDLLIEKADREDVELLFIDDRVAADRLTRNGGKIYSLWDVYTIADLVTYPSLREGWGNQFLEGIKAKKPLLVYEYPVFRQDIKDKGFKIISLGDQCIYNNQGLAEIDEWVIDRAADMAVILLTNGPHLQDVVDGNYLLAQQHYSLEALSSYIKPLFNG